eukprot:MONOS_1933.1-p1 / transcript=MONOS_1933.1 / gene=MONOS_1933 / organism=Monocercomonoides_exilis_PA203 / gene_product=unspecified product / transcript_product=unspecified product / location=Mono_scaffold00037:58258-61260(-) / protein_length=953 / sequence_SO=supercontig / SO=protein_coding / is_pseudo=false
MQGVSELLSTIDSLEFNFLGLFLSCLFGVKTMDASIARKEVVRLLGCTVKVHGARIQPYLTKIITYLISRLKDNETGMRDICAETFGFLAEELTQGVNWKQHSLAQNPFRGYIIEGMDYPIRSLIEPLLHNMEETGNKNFMEGASLAIQAICERADPDAVALSWPFFGQRLILLFSHPDCFLGGQLLLVLSTMFMVCPCVMVDECERAMLIAQEYLSQPEWNTRRAAVDCLIAVITTYVQLFTQTSPLQVDEIVFESPSEAKASPQLLPYKQTFNEISSKYSSLPFDYSNNPNFLSSAPAGSFQYKTPTLSQILIEKERKKERAEEQRKLFECGQVGLRIICRNKVSVKEKVEKIRYDRVRQVREGVAELLSLLNLIPDPVVDTDNDDSPDMPSEKDVMSTLGEWSQDNTAKDMNAQIDSGQLTSEKNASSSSSEPESGFDASTMSFSQDQNPDVERAFDGTSSPPAIRRQSPLKTTITAVRRHNEGTSVDEALTEEERISDTTRMDGEEDEQQRKAIRVSGQKDKEQQEGELNEIASEQKNEHESENTKKEEKSEEKEAKSKVQADVQQKIEELSATVTKQQKVIERLTKWMMETTHATEPPFDLNMLSSSMRKQEAQIKESNMPDELQQPSLDSENQEKLEERNDDLIEEKNDELANSSEINESAFDESDLTKAHQISQFQSDKSLNQTLDESQNLKEFEKGELKDRTSVHQHIATIQRADQSKEQKSEHEIEESPFENQRKITESDGNPHDIEEDNNAANSKEKDNISEEEGNKNDEQINKQDKKEKNGMTELESSSERVLEDENDSSPNLSSNIEQPQQSASESNQDSTNDPLKRNDNELNDDSKELQTQRKLTKAELLKLKVEKRLAKEAEERERKEKEQKEKEEKRSQILKKKNEEQLAKKAREDEARKRRYENMKRRRLSKMDKDDNELSEEYVSTEESSNEKGG